MSETNNHKLNYDSPKGQRWLSWRVRKGGFIKQKLTEMLDVGDKLCEARKKSVTTLPDS